MAKVRIIEGILLYGFRKTLYFLLIPALIAFIGRISSDRFVRIHPFIFHLFEKGWGQTRNFFELVGKVSYTAIAEFIGNF